MTSMKCNNCQKISSILQVCIVPDRNFQQTIANGGIGKTVDLCKSCLLKSI